ncbi:MAG: flagellar motor protein MotB [Leptospirales bacterium]
MIRRMTAFNRKPKDPEEKPFWISFADIMTALMILFLFIMSVALMAVTKTISQEQKLKVERLNDISVFLNNIAAISSHYPEVSLDRVNEVLYTGTHFSTNSSDIPEAESDNLRQFVASILPVTKGL